MGGGFEFARGMGGWVNGWMGGWVGEVWASERARGEHRFMKLMKEKKGENYSAFYFAGKRKIFFYVYQVFTWEKKIKSADTYY